MLSYYEKLILIRSLDFFKENVKYSKDLNHYFAFTLQNTDYNYIFNDGTIYWVKLICNQLDGRVVCMYYTTEEILNSIEPSLQEKLLFNLDLF